ncbi:MAG: hypothetical protein IIC54_11240 [Proteobacteria bacterium]|nr:hypothetical protein [Pseudomonadota bacterium]MCH7957402.1 hypothetical protein [Pseudomonadota bacterium]MCH8214625.1 hypothetical protein [Pseudomonadota bacterium]
MTQDHTAKSMFEKNMGLDGSPIFVNSEMDSLHIAADLPQCVPQQAAERGVVTPVQGAQVGEVIATAQNCGVSMVDFPTVI